MDVRESNKHVIKREDAKNEQINVLFFEIVNLMAHEIDAMEG